MAKVQSIPPAPEPVESCSAVASAFCRSASVSPGTKLGSADQIAESSDTLTEWASDRSTSAKLSVPVDEVSSAVEPDVFGCSATVADPGPLVMATASLVPVMTTETVWLALVELSLTLTL
jgi:hypothetical protein